MAKFEQILRERFRNILKRSFKNHKNSEIACYPHNQLTFYENDNPQKHGFISQWFNSIENCVQKKGNCSGRSRVRRILLTCIQLLLLQFLDVIWSMPTNFVFTSERPLYSLALFSSFICTCTTSKRYKFASKRTLDYFPKKYPEYANNWLVYLTRVMTSQKLSQRVALML